MPVSEQQKEDYKCQVIALKQKLMSCAKDIQQALTVGNSSKSDPEQQNLFRAKILRATEAKKSFVEAWDRVILIHIKLDCKEDFPTEDDTKWKDDLFDVFDQIKALEINLKTETSFQNSTSFGDSRKTLPLLDRIKLPNFDGEVRMWARFRDIFLSMVDKDPCLDPVTKLYLLRDSLSSEALSVVNKFDITDANYSLAWRALTDAYENPRVLATAYLEQILNFKMRPKPQLCDFQKFLTDVSDSVSELNALRLEEAQDKILALAMLRTFDPHTRHRFELAQTGTEFPTTSAITKFVRNQCQALKLSGSLQPIDSSLRARTRIFSSPSHQVPVQPRSRYPRRSSPRFNSHSFVTSSSPSEKHQTKVSNHHIPRRKDERNTSPSASIVCCFCQQHHILSRCPVFIGLSVNDRCEFAAKFKGCKSCLNPGHKVQDCRSRWKCRICQQPHHTLLHRQQLPGQKTTNPACTSSVQEVCNHSGDTHHRLNNIQVVLGTARAIITDATGREHHVRLLLDCGGHRSFITRKCAETVNLKIRPTHSQITGLGDVRVAETQGLTHFTLKSLHGNTKLKMTAAVLPDRITSALPLHPLPEEIYKQFRSFTLADPLFHQPQDIDILIGADFYDTIVTGPFHKQPDLPSLLPTLFGDVVMGSYRSTEPVSSQISMFCQPSQAISSQLQAFWELEEPLPAARRSPEDQYCEDHFVATHSRTTEGRYIVRLPFASEPRIPGDNRSSARKRFASMELKLSSDDQFRNDYTNFMKEYEELGHMQVATKPSSYIIPHFGIRQKKLRVVFDASSGSSANSLNDLLLPGPSLQTDIREVLTQFRLFPIAITTDIVKMYRQILVHPEDRQYQHILWRENHNQPLLEYQLNTVTYGITSSPFLALRSIIQLTKDEGKNFPLAVERLKKKIFVDDIATGADSPEEAAFLCKELEQLFLRGCFDLSKWSSNVPSILPDGCKHSEEPTILQPEKIPEVMVLGLIWDPNEDTFAYVVHKLPSATFSKRIVLSFISRIFDPLGFLSPVIFTAKLFMQELWKNNLDWDDRLPDSLHGRWTNLTNTWNQLSMIRVPRYMHSRHVPCQLVGFCDASALGYAAVIYLRAEVSSNQTTTFILASKTKVAPVKFVSIARLELCGAFLLAKLYSSIDLPEVNIQQKIFFSDSTVALGWIHTPSHLLCTFEANRVTTINDLSTDVDWRHVRTEDNPADVASRGLLPSQAKDCHLWWNGPSWLQLPVTHWPSSSSENPSTSTAFQEQSSCMVTTPHQADVSWMLRFSSFQTLLREVTRILRFAHRSAYNFQHYSDPIKPAGLSRATLVCARVVQRKLLPKGSSSPELSALSPFHDELGVLRVGGRLQHAQISFSAKHPIIIPKNSHLGRLVVRDIHQNYYHAGPSLTLAILRSRFWIPSATRFIKGELSRCVSCIRLRPSALKAIMAPLPSSRLIPGRAFLQTGIDYAGPFSIRDSLRRKPVLTKGYICIFVCMSTKAMHLEAVSSLSTEAFLATLDRFVARRGKPQVIHSDNSTNFVGASRYLKELTSFLINQQEPTSRHLANSGIEWCFIPPRSPHFGGLWEAGVKSVKSLLTSAVAPQPFTFEELSTMLARIESMLNSRRLCPLTDNPDSFEALTPAHFLIGLMSYDVRGIVRVDDLGLTTSSDEPAESCKECFRRQ